MKSPFAILLAIVVLVGIGIGVVAILFVGPSDGGQGDETIQIASESDLPTPSARNETTRTRAESNETSPKMVVVSTSVSVEKVSSDEVPELETRVESGETLVVATVEVAGEGRGAGGFGFRAGGDGGAGGPGGGNFQAIQEAIESNPEIAALIEKAQSGNMTQANQARLRELMQEVLTEAGIGPPGGGQGGFGVQPIQGKIAYIFGSTVTIEHSDDSGLTTDVQVNDDTDITLIRELSIGDLAEGDTVSGAVQRSESGKINILALGVVPDVPGGGFGLRGGAGSAIFGGGNTNVLGVEGRVSVIDGDTIHLETDQGALRLTVIDDTVITSTSNGAVSDLTEGMAAIVIGPEEGGAVQARNIVAGPESLLGEGGAGLMRGAGRPGQAGQ